MDIFKSIVDTFTSIGENISNMVNSLNFYEIEKLAIDFIKNNQKKGLKKPVYLEVAITRLEESKEAKAVKLTYNAYYEETKGQYIQQTWEKEFSALNKIPSQVEELLKKKKEIKIKIDNIVDLLSETVDASLYVTSFDKLLEIVKKYQKEISIKEDIEVSKKKVVIEDRIFKTSVQFIFEVKQKSEDRKIIKGHNFVEIKDMPEDVAKLFSEKGQVEFEI